MTGALTANIDGFARRDVTFDGKTKPVLVTGTSGPAVLVIHEVFGFTPLLARFCRWIADAGMRVYAAGEPTRAAADDVIAFFKTALAA